MPNRYTVVLPSVTNVPADSVNWTFHTFGTETAENGAGDIAAFVTQVSAYISPTISRAVDSQVLAYDLSDPEPRSPIFTGDFELNAPTSTSPFPNEVACCLSYRADYVSGSPPARHRGRIYIGPLNFSAGSENGGVSRPHAAFRTALADAAIELESQLRAHGTFWAVYSRTDDAVRQVVGGWIDNEWDTQRRRGWRSTSRQLWNATP